jgi:phosphatidylserine/phosphatidylglycerophosphate/cardiolipin synthase-like enzyme
MGSFNNDKWSWSMNSEVVLSCSNKAITDQAFKIIENFKKDTQEVKLGLVQVVKSSTSGFWKWFLRTSEHVMNTKKNNKYFILQSYVDDDSNPIEDRYAMRMKRIESFKINTSTLSMITYI